MGMASVYPSATGKQEEEALAFVRGLDLIYSVLTPYKAD